MNVMRVRFAICLLLASSAAMAQEAQKFAPFTVQEQEFVQLRAWLDEQPHKFAAPVMQWLLGRERMAQEEAKKGRAPSPPIASDQDR
jgi:hypothetical protein